MIVITLTDCPPKLRGDLSKWLCEINTGVYVGNLSSRVRDELWERVCSHLRTGKVTGVFYIEILNGVLSVMPYEYIDRDACVSGTLTNLEKILSGKMVPQVALAEGKIKVEGNVDKVMVLAELLKQA